MYFNQFDLIVKPWFQLLVGIGSWLKQSFQCKLNEGEEHKQGGRHPVVWFPRPLLICAKKFASIMDLIVFVLKGCCLECARAALSSPARSDCTALLMWFEKHTTLIFAVQCLHMEGATIKWLESCLLHPLQCRCMHICSEVHLWVFHLLMPCLHLEERNHSSVCAVSYISWQATIPKPPHSSLSSHIITFSRYFFSVQSTIYVSPLLP